MVLEIIYRKDIMKISRFRETFELSCSFILLISFFIVETSFVPSVYSSAPQPYSGVSSLIPQLPDQTQLNEFTYVDSETDSYAVFENLGFSDVPVAIGSLRSNRDDIQLAPSLQIEAADDLYVLRDPRDSDFLEVIERLPAGGFGRLLRYRGSVNGRKVDLEFVFEDEEKRITILDHRAGRFYRTTFTGEIARPLSLLLPSPEERDLTLELIVHSIPSQKFLHILSEIETVSRTRGLKLYSVCDIFSEQNFWMSRLLRGPPGGDVSQ